ncbi:MAG TPA: DinB family protein [Bryobacteraceae bacterium]|nr:DinB family protein [Bryobacteraceae bacterium]
MRLAALLLLCASALPLCAADNPVVQRLATRWDKSGVYMIELASQMPADGYVAKPNANEMTFGEQMLHIASSNVFQTRGFGGGKRATFDPKRTDKESAITALRESYEVGGAAIRALTDAELNSKIVDTGQGEMTALEAIILTLNHAEHHRGQAIVYLRVKGIKPTDYRF